MADPKNTGQVTKNELLEAIGEDYQKNQITDDLSEESSDDGDTSKKEKLGLKTMNSMTEKNQRRFSMNDGETQNSRASRLSKKEVQKHKLKLKFNEDKVVENDDNPEIEFYHG